MIYFADCIRSYLIVLFLLFIVAEGADLKVPEPALRANKKGCNKPAGHIGDSFIQKCLRMTCTRKGRRVYWKESFASDMCCNYNQKWYEMGQNIKQTLSTNGCYMINIYCAKNKASEPEIMIDSDDQCANLNEVEALLKIHSNNSKENIQKMSDNIVNLLQIFLNKTEKPPLHEVTSEPKKTNPKPDTTTTTTTTHPTTSEACDSEVLFIGPGIGSDGKSEVLSIPSLVMANCTPPTFPSAIYGYVATMTVDGPVLCGGGWPADADCYLLTWGGVWLGTPPMKPMQTKRQMAAAAKLGNAWWVTGGYGSGKSLATTELWFNQSWHSYTNLPTTLQGHCLVKLNSTHFFLTGGYTGSAYSASSYIFSEEKGFVKQDDMITARYTHACSLYSDSLVFVAGGYNGSSPLQKTEYFSLLTMKWLPGPDLPVATGGGKMVSINGKTVYIGGTGNKKIFQLEKLTGLPTNVDWWKWIEVGEMKTARRIFDVVKMKVEDCKYWNSLTMIQ